MRVGIQVCCGTSDGRQKKENSTQIWYDVSIDKNTYKKGVEFSLSSLTSNARFRQQVINNRRNME